MFPQNSNLKKNMNRNPKYESEIHNQIINYMNTKVILYVQEYLGRGRF